MPVRIITLSENTAGQPDLLAEWGLSILVETPETSILLDAGASISAARNLDTLDIDYRKIDKIILSHGHYDHTGGLQPLLKKLRKEVEIIAHPDIWVPKYSRRKGKPDKYIGMPYLRQELESLGARFTLTRGPLEVTGNILTTGEIPLITDFEEIGSELAVRTAEGYWEQDNFPDDLALVIKTSTGLAVICGCAHRGLINTLYHARDITGESRVRLVLGGSHLKDSSVEQVWQTISALNQMGVRKVAVSHCTGPQATLLIAQTFGRDFIFNNTGNIIELD
jgi:7,8-dihydropterin-6-yl-methyl-4-(beta-D-ribofuranosyl)aminobenzene 5'-phosphate synthase